MLKLFKQISCDIVFKTIFVFFIGYLLFLLTNIATTMRINSEVGRYQFDKDGSFVIDTKTGKTKQAEY
jgi:hypothetical protein